MVLAKIDGECITESRNAKTMDIDLKSAGEIVRLMNEEDKLVAAAVERELDKIAKAVDLIVKAFKSGGRLLYIGAGTSGRLAILDASECPPTFGTDSSLVRGIIAGGRDAIENAIEGAEDDFNQGRLDLELEKLTSKDILVGITASGRTPYVMGALKYANELGADTVLICCNEEEKLEKVSDISINLLVGPEVITGSTRLKAGTAQKMTLNMLTTASMIISGKTYENLMVDIQVTNNKLARRAQRIIRSVTGADEKTVEEVLKETGNNVKLSIFMILSGLPKEKAEKVLLSHGGFIRKAINAINKERVGENEKDF